MLALLFVLFTVYPEGDPMSTQRAVERLPMIERLALEEGVPDVFDPRTAAATAIVESGAGRNLRRKSTVKRRSRSTDPRWEGKLFRFRGVPAQYCGELQMGNYAGQDVGFTEIPVYRKGPDGLRYRVTYDTTKSLLEDTEEAYRMYLRYMIRYQRWHEWDPRWMAFIWKAGPGSAKKTRAVLASEPDLSFIEALDKAARKFGITRARVYVERFDREFERIARADAEENWSEMRAAGERVFEAIAPRRLAAWISERMA